jgi:hypothetical protein
MNRLYLLLVTLVFTAGAAAQQSLGDVARQARAERKAPATMRFDDDYLRRSSSGLVSTVGQDTTKEADQTGKAPEGKDQDKKQTEKSKSEDWTRKVDDQKKEIATLQRELDILQREQRLRAAAFYGDAGTQLRDQGKFAQDSRQEQEQIDAKKQALDTAQQKLGDLQEQARKAGAPSE